MPFYRSMFFAYCLSYMGFFMGRSEIPNVLLREPAGRPEVYNFPASAGTSSGNKTVTKSRACWTIC